jgi:primosomal protein N' (replication factor Y)
MNPILRIALPVPLNSLFDYRARGGPVAAGCRVLVPFGRRRMVGVVVAQAATSDLGDDKLKDIERVLDDAPLLTDELMATLRWAARYYQHPLGEVLQAALPVALRSARALPPSGVAALQLTPVGRAALGDPKRRRGTRIDALLGALAAGPLPIAHGDVRGAGSASVRAALAHDWLERVHVAAAALPRSGIAGPPLNDEQRSAADAVIAAADRFAPFLLDGVTGSGKTEVYLDIIKACIAQGRQALVLVPEIALTPQALRRFRERLGIDIAAVHSGLGESERARAWLGAARGEAPVILGTRSALFVPLPKAGVIIVDEEHDASYKQQEGFRYHARDLAVMRAKALGVPVVLGSATPSLESLANVAAERYQSLRLTHRAGRRRLAQTTAAAWTRRTDAGRDRGLPRARRTGIDLQESARLRTGAALPRLRLECAVSRLRARHDPASRRRPTALPSLRPRAKDSARMPCLWRPRAASAGRGHRAP